MTDERPWYAPRPPDEVIPIPWLHPEAIKFFEGILKPEFSVLEHGAGGSTLWLASRVAYILTIEHNPEWLAKIRALAPDNVALIPFLPSPPVEPRDIFFIDGERTERGECLLLADTYVRPGGWVVLDNANRPEYVKERTGLITKGFTLVARFVNNVNGCKYFVTEFWRCGLD